MKEKSSWGMVDLFDYKIINKIRVFKKITTVHALMLFRIENPGGKPLKHFHRGKPSGLPTRKVIFHTQIQYVILPATPIPYLVRFQL